MPTHNKSNALITGKKYCRFHEQYHPADHNYWYYRANVSDKLGKCKAAEIAKTAEKMKDPDYKKKRSRSAVAYHMRRLKYDPMYKLKVALRIRLNRFLAQSGKTKSVSAIRDLGCTVLELKAHIESQFVDGMSWENHSIDGWHIDHDKPLSSASTQEELKALCHYTNLKPLWAKDNLAKGGVN